MRINTEWLQKQYDGEGENKPDAYVLAILRVGEKVLDLIDLLPESTPIDANELVGQADKELDEGITGNMAAYIALIATKCSSRGEEFRVSWNTKHGKPDSKGVVNPAIFTIA